jgi:hypothetical protein
VADGEIKLWLEGGIHIKTVNAYSDPVELALHEAPELIQGSRS